MKGLVNISFCSRVINCVMVRPTRWRWWMIHSVLVVIWGWYFVMLRVVRPFTTTAATAAALVVLRLLLQHAREVMVRVVRLFILLMVMMVLLLLLVVMMMVVMTTMTSIIVHLLIPVGRDRGYVAPVWGSSIVPHGRGRGASIETHRPVLAGRGRSHGGKATASGRGRTTAALAAWWLFATLAREGGTATTSASSSVSTPGHARGIRRRHGLGSIGWRRG